MRLLYFTATTTESELFYDVESSWIFCVAFYFVYRQFINNHVLHVAGGSYLMYSFSVVFCIESSLKDSFCNHNQH